MHTPTKQQSLSGRATVVCLHASASTGGQWSVLRSHLDRGLKVLTPDFHGHGAAPAWLGCDEDIVAADASRVARVVESCPGDVHLVGHSYGGAVALRVALHRPDRVASVAVYEPVVFRLLFDYHGRRRPASEVIEVGADIRRRVRSGDPAVAAARFVDYWGGPGVWQGLSIGQQTDVVRRMPVVAAHFTGLARDVPRLADYRSLRAPVLMLAGSEMRAPVRRIRELLRFALPDATLDTMPGMGHMGPVTHASAVARRIARFVEQHAIDVAAAGRKLAA